MSSLLLVTLLVVSSGVCSGLNIALMSLKLSDLRHKAMLGDLRAERVLPLRENSHLTLASILLTNVAVISATSLVLGQEFNGLVAGIVSTLLIVIFGEVIPQALFVGHALAFCAEFSLLMHLMVMITYPVSKPLQILLDIILGKEVEPLESRHELGLLIGEHADSEESEMDKNELEIMRGALALSEKRVRDIMTPLQQVYYLTDDAVIDGRRIDEIKERGFSRIPVFNHRLTKVYGILLMKELVDINFNKHSYPVANLHLHPTRMVGSMTALDTMFRKFIVARSHLMPVERDGAVIGVVTIEDLIEEIIGHEIEDESDQHRATAR